MKEKKSNGIRIKAVFSVQSLQNPECLTIIYIISKRGHFCIYVVFVFGSIPISI